MPLDHHPDVHWTNGFPSRQSARPTTSIRSETPRHKLRAMMAAIVLMYIVALLWNFRYIIGEHFEYMGFLFSMKSAGHVAATIIIALLPVLWLPLAPERPSGFLYVMLYLAVYVPACLVPAFTEGVADLAVTRLQLLLVTSFGLAGLPYFVRTFDFLNYRLSKLGFWTLLILLSGGTMLWVAQAFGLKLHIHSFSTVYDVREAHSDVVEGHNRLLIYLIIWQANVIGPLLIAYAWSRKQVLPGICALIAQIWIYSVSGYKTFFLAIPFVAFVIWLARFRRPGSMMLLLAAMLLALVMLCSFLDYSEDGFDFSTIFVRRLLLTPGRQTYWYYDFFSDNTKVMLSHSIFSRFLDYPYEAPPPELVGHAHFATYEARANGNVWADAYANFGAVGMLAYGAILGAFCWAYDCAARGVDVRIALALLAMPIISLCNSSLLTSLLTHGLGLALLILMLCPLRGKKPLPHKVRRRATTVP